MWVNAIVWKSPAGPRCLPSSSTDLFEGCLRRETHSSAFSLTPPLRARRKTAAESVGSSSKRLNSTLFHKTRPRDTKAQCPEGWQVGCTTHGVAPSHERGHFMTTAS